MLTNLDMHTLITVLVVGHTISLTFLIAGFKNNCRQREDWNFISGRACQLLGLVLIGQRGVISDFLTIIIGNSLIMTGQALESIAWVSFKNGTAKIWRFFYGVSLGVILLCLWNVLFYLSLKDRIALLMILQSVLFLIPGFYLSFSRKRSSPTQILIGIMYVVGSLAALWRYTYTIGVNSYSLFMKSLPHSGFFVVMVFLLFGGSLGYILVKKEYLNNELEESNRNLYREKEMVACYEAELRKHQVERAEFLALQAQIKPHFLQNTLGVIGHFCRVDSEKARQLLYDLSVYLRSTFELTADNVPLDEELKVVRAYLAIESARFGARLDVRYELAGELSTCLIPPFTIQPLVENAVHHGIAARRQGGAVRINIQAVDGGVAFLVEDNGVGMSVNPLQYLGNDSIQTGREGQGFGLFNVDRRLKDMYGGGLKIETAPGEGTRVSFFIPGTLNCRLGEERHNA